MGKPKQRQPVVPTSQDGSPSDTDLDGEDSWVIVKRQRVTILIPTLPHAKKSTMPKPGSSELEAMPLEAVNNTSTVPVETSNRMPLVDEQEKVTSIAPNRGTKMSRKIPTQHILASHKLPRVNVEIESENLDRTETFKPQNVLGLSNNSRTIKQPRLLHVQGHFLDGSKLLNQRLRASLLEKKLQKAGGLSRWLASIGLGQFVKIFQGRSVSKFQLVSLTMQKLKDMGADAVGPRRKLMHAIDCICQPYCFESY
ncbi:uncharacterized protein LOC110620011 [Manihot esculenta]|uniref:SAM domain-containing protein n=2 Tax=Manihot esculenta TaxID=3983 RepID=A0A251KAM9_MANES|nr:uncharacterized protein LOC110620011 [Manihot esculenta]XP_021619248.1 uncharacterized protein LOC110620011 [Manihot esculenta]XP_021619249.1 uncharacterized protein LOC110620011 [Manihot esculenta]KAG8648781.1 hypothetical protein MANES_08G038100v8 [Manihot esculenta]OAY43049.1 hypothetical protein MANES_08G038100v8 [Manihot esculenta]OAY43050.1 hypothetical protein MANES_08G038100v8 [Manihot esculenta]